MDESQRLVTREEFCDAGVSRSSIIKCYEKHFPGKTAVGSTHLQKMMHLLVPEINRRDGCGYGHNHHGNAHGYGCGSLTYDGIGYGHGCGSKWGTSFGHGCELGYGRDQSHYESGSFIDNYYLDGYGDGRCDDDDGDDDDCYGYGYGYGQ